MFGAANRSGAQEVTVSVAISMKDAIEELRRQFQKARPTVVLRFNLGASGELQKQIEAGAPVDLFISAAQGDYDLEIEVPRFVYELLHIDRDRHWQFSIHSGSIHVLAG